MSAIAVEMARRGSRAHAGRARRRRAPAIRLGPSSRDLVIVSRALADLAEFLERRQESAGRGRVVLDRRVGERRAAVLTVDRERRRRDRRHPPSSAQALMEVLGFMVVPSGRPPGEPAKRRAAAPPRPKRHPRTRRPKAATGHRARRRRS
jgi:hypothetical protein